MRPSSRVVTKTGENPKFTPLGSKIFPTPPADLKRKFVKMAAMNPHQKSGVTIATGVNTTNSERPEIHARIVVPSLSERAITWF